MGREIKTHEEDQRPHQDQRNSHLRREWVMRILAREVAGAIRSHQQVISK